MAIIKAGLKKAGIIKREGGAKKAGGAKIIVPNKGGSGGKFHGGGRQTFNKGHVKNQSQGQGQWVFMPQGGFKGNWGHSHQKAQSNKFMDKLNKIDADRKVWIGGLVKNVTWKTLEKHFVETCGTKPAVTEVLPRGAGCCAFKTAEDAQTAIATVNGSEINGKVIEVDVWTQKEKKAGDKKKVVAGNKFAKKVSAKAQSKTSKVEPSLKVWVGGLDEKTNGGKLKKHFVDNGATPDFAEIMKRGTACVTFKDEGDAAAAVGIVNGTELDGNIIEVDVWTKPEKKLKGEKKEDA